jgi:hypothetical protein
VHSPEVLIVIRSRFAPAFGMLLVLFVAGCGGGEKKPPPTTQTETKLSADEVAAERDKLSPEDRAVVDAQEWCAVSTDERLGSMGPPLKLDIKGESVFVCCKGCKRKAESDPDKTLKTVADLKAKKAALAPR